jgi:hypothetical protein
LLTIDNRRVWGRVFIPYADKTKTVEYRWAEEDEIEKG